MDLDGYDAVVYDLDGTLAVLDVDWPALREELASLLADQGAAPDDVAEGVWNLLEHAESVGLGDEAHAVIRRHEVAGAEHAARLPLADGVAPLAADGVAVGVFSLNSTEAVEAALASIGIDDAVDAVVGREPGLPRKPDPEPLHAVLETLDVDSDDAVFVGDSAGDEAAAEAAGVAFRYAADLDDSYPEDWAAVTWDDDQTAADLVEETYGADE